MYTWHAHTHREVYKCVCEWAGVREYRSITLLNEPQLQPPPHSTWRIPFVQFTSNENEAEKTNQLYTIPKRPCRLLSDGYAYPSFQPFNWKNKYATNLTTLPRKTSEIYLNPRLRLFSNATPFPWLLFWWDFCCPIPVLRSPCALVFFVTFEGPKRIFEVCTLLL